MANQTLVQVREIEQEAQAIRAKFEKNIANKEKEFEHQLETMRQDGKAEIDRKVQAYAESLKKDQLEAESELQATMTHYQEKSAQALHQHKDRLVDQIIDRVKQRFLDTSNE